jgi:S1-C subfamily serine protease
MEPPPPPPPRSSLRRWVVAMSLMVLVLVGAAAGVGVSLLHGTSSTESGSNGSVSGSVSQVDHAVVDITSRLAGDVGVAAGTGMLISSSGQVLTNNHVVQSGARITAQVDGSGADYPATVVGVDPVHDVALLQLQGASGLPTISFGDSSSVKVGDGVTALGNALGQGGVPVASSGNVTALGQTITVSNDMGGNETLNNLIEIDAQILQGDSGGPLLDSSGKVVGMVTAAEVSGPRRNPTSTAGYAIPANDALSVVHQIQRGGGGSVQVGNPPIIGVEIAAGGNGAGVMVSGVQPGSPADQAGISPGDVLTAVDGQAVTSAAQLSSAVRVHKAGDQIRVAWIDTRGQPHSGSLRLVAGPPA